MKIEELLYQYFKERKLASATEQHYYNVVKLIIRDTGIKNVVDLTFININSWMIEVCKRNVSEVTWNNYLKHIGLLIKFAVKQGHLTQSPKLNQLCMRTYIERPKVISHSDLSNIVNFIKSDMFRTNPSWFWETVVIVLFFTGMRRRQLTGLQWKHVNLDNKEINLPATTSKTRRAWTIPMSDEVHKSLCDVRKRTVKRLNGDDDLTERYVFDIGLFNNRYKCQNHLTGEALSGFFKRLSGWTNTSISAHRLRHTFATRLATLGMYKELQQLMGHASIHTTMRYIHPETEHMRSLVETLRIHDDKPKDD